MTTVDRRIERTRARIRQAFIEMLTEKDYDAITVAELAKRACIDRKTFYLHYKDKDDLLHSLEREHSLEVRRLMTELVWSNDVLPDIASLWTTLTEAFEAVAPVHRRIAHTPSYAFILIDELELLQEAFRDTLRSHTDLSAEHLDLYAEYYAGGVLALYWRWLRTGETVPFTTVVSTAVDAIYHGTTTIVTR